MRLGRRSADPSAAGPWAVLRDGAGQRLTEQAELRSWLLARVPPDGAADGGLEGRVIVGPPLSAKLAVLSARQTRLAPLPALARLSTQRVLILRRVK
jgi:hypothetical protein